MRVLLIGYGKMGQAIERLALERGHEIAGVINVENTADLEKFNGVNVDVAIEFTQPDVALGNIDYCLKNGIPIVSGTTGWQDQLEGVKKTCAENGGTFLYASNFSLGVNLFFKLNEWMAKLMNGHEYVTTMEEVHHIHKKDAPSGTAVTLAEGILRETDNLREWTLEEDSTDKLPIKAVRKNEVPGTHIIKYRSEVDEIEISHKAYSREGFVLGAVLVSEWIVNQNGVLTMDDFLSSAGKL